jgi:hypothetical protein
MADLDELVTWCNIANDECDFGMSLQLGLDLFCHDPMFQVPWQTGGGIILKLLTRCTTVVLFSPSSNVVREGGMNLL